MPIDSRQKRMSALFVLQPWRGGLIDATETGFTQGNRQAGAFMYSGILADVPVVGPAGQGGGFISIGLRIGLSLWLIALKTGLPSQLQTLLR